MTTAFRFGLWMALGLAANACSAKRDSAVLAEARAFLSDAAPTNTVVELQRVDQRSESGALRLFDVAGRRVLAVADEDGAALALVDAETGKKLLHEALWCAPQQLIGGARGELFVTHARCNAVSRYQLTRGEQGNLKLVETARREVASEPVALALSPRSDMLLAVSAWGQTLSQFSLPAFELTHTAPLAREPRAVSISDDGARALVSHAVGGVLSEVELANNALKEHSLSAASQRVSFLRVHHWGDFLDHEFMIEPNQQTSQPRRIRHRFRSAVSVSSSDLPATQGFALATMGDQVWVPQVFSNPGELGQVAHGYGAVGSPLPATLQDVAVLNLASGESNRGGKPFAVIHGWSERRKNLCRLPRATAFDLDRMSLLVACVGSDRVVEFDALARDPARTEVTEWSLPRGPEGLALDVERRRGYAWSRFARALSVLQLAEGDVTRVSEHSVAAVEQRRAATPGGRVLAIFDLPPLTPPTAEEARILAGMALFHRSGDAQISADGRACASCHPAGRDDALRWRTPGALLVRQTPMLDGRIAGTAPYGWLGQHATLEQHLHNTVTSRLQGQGLTPEQMSELVAYLMALPGPPRDAQRWAEPVAALSFEAKAQAEEAVQARTAEQRGETLYHRSDVGCADCHGEDGSVDGLQHAFFGKTSTDTPSLRFIAGTAPYFHDGKYGNLEDLVLHTQGAMGQLAKLSDNERSDLVAYLRTL